MRKEIKKKKFSLSLVKQGKIPQSLPVDLIYLMYKLNHI